ncbi:probable palmitoyltransferase ZDHHC24 [Fopius arisanus]|uniref:Palmitoyltransferase n=1 Tax=Fopius arisanus TaxID=64838 RepID=A0A9R1TJ20_9HYME|nr:PREDICTED: probable palmitoyltransferase ZDHHC24 [Fopius arisanus]
MNFRKKIWPKTAGDGASMVFVLIIVPVIYWFELWVVLPQLFSPGSSIYLFHFTLGTFILINIVGNFTYTVLCDTSTRSVILPVSKAKVKEGWRFCLSCESLAPPRSWHCQTCGICILKRDHHCVFTGCCVGHFNHRYFLMFVLYLFIATVYSFYYNNYFIWGRIKFDFPMSIVKMVFPLAFFVFGFDYSMDQFYLTLYIISIVGMAFTGALSVYHFHLVFTGGVAHERAKRNSRYNLGWRQNLKDVFGERWYLTWILPYFESRLLGDGINWKTAASWREKTR